MEIFKWLLQTDSGMSGFLLRITLAVVIFPRSSESARMVRRPWLQRNHSVLHRLWNSAPFALLAMAAEFLGPIGGALGFLTRIASFGIRA